MRARGFVRRWVEDVIRGVVDDALDVLDLADYGAFSDLGERVDVLEGHNLDEALDRLEELEGAELGERVDYLEGLGLEHAIAFLDSKVAGLERVDVDELSELSAGLEVRVENCETEGAVDRVRLDQLEQRYLALEHAVGVFAGTGDAAALFEHVRRAGENGGRS